VLALIPVVDEALEAEGDDPLDPAVEALVAPPLLGVAAPPFAAAYAVRCVRTSVSRARVASSRLGDDFALLSLLPVVPAAAVEPLPDVPVALAPAGVLVSAVADPAEPVPRRSASSLSIAATSVPQFAFDADPCCADAGALVSAAAVAEARLSAAMWRFNSAS
jgi:hypothetical protein